MSGHIQEFCILHVGCTVHDPFDLVTIAIDTIYLKYQSVPVFTIFSAEELKTSFLYRVFIYNWQHKDRTWGVVHVFLSDFVLAFVTQCSSLSLLFRCPYLCLQGECVHACVKHPFTFRGVGEHPFVTQGECVHACVKHTFTFRGLGEHTFVTQGECVHACVKHTFTFRGLGEHTFVTQTSASRVSVIVHTVRYVIEPLPPR